MKDNKYYVIATTWEGASAKELFDKWIENGEYDAMCASKEDAFNEAQRIRDEELADDEYVYIIFNNEVWER